MQVTDWRSPIIFTACKTESRKHVLKKGRKKHKPGQFRKQTAGGDADLTNIVVAFSKRENAVNIRNILTRSGVEVSAVCLTGAKVLQHAEMWSQGIVICGSRLQDMPYTELRELLPPGFDMLLIASSDRWIDALPEGIVGLPSPLKVYDLMNTLEMMSRRRRAAGKSAGNRDGREMPENVRSLNRRKHFLWNGTACLKKRRTGIFRKPAWRAGGI